VGDRQPRLKWIEYKDFSETEERAHMEEAIRLHTEVVGTRPRGWYTGRTSMHTVQLAAEEGGFDYVADSYADDCPTGCASAGMTS
jgi:peptidoglycan/xylan/chitin deacetylase (PgdA/CDA1 family)